MVAVVGVRDGMMVVVMVEGQGCHVMVSMSMCMLMAMGLVVDQVMPSGWQGFLGSFVPFETGVPGECFVVT